MQRRRLIVGNWKMNGSRASARELLTMLRERLPAQACADVAVCVPFPYLEMAERLLHASPIGWGVQTISEFEGGAHTGEVSADMARDFHCRFVLIGHSERRASNGESDAIVAIKTRLALRAGLTPIVCVGESQAQHESGETVSVVLRQLDTATAALSTDERRRCVIAYEPIWAIGTGLAATPAHAAEIHAAIRRSICSTDPIGAASTRILYGGSVTVLSAAQLFGHRDIDGGLIGGASLLADEFLAIANSAA